jgi:uncharacterized protein (TIGR02466 family)
MDQLEQGNYFSCPIYSIKKPEFLEPLRSVTEKYLEQSKACMKIDNPITVMTGDYSHEVEVSEFGQYVSQTAWNILSSLGYDMDNLVTYFMEMWTQEHNFHSNMEQHVHGLGAQISAFYFLDVPEDGCKIVIYDPRPAKVITNLPLKDNNVVSAASSTIVFTPEAGMMFFAPSWLPHSFSRNLNKDNPMRFVHMNISVMQKPEEPKPEVIVI